MKKKLTKDINSILKDFQNFLKKKPTPGEMLDEVRMMKFKIRPVSGDLMSVDLKNDKFIETLWNLGKLDEFYQSEYPKLSRKNKQVFFQIFENLYQKYRNDLNQVDVHQERTSHHPQHPQLLEVEIFKERKVRKTN